VTGNTSVPGTGTFLLLLTPEVGYFSLAFPIRRELLFMTKRVPIARVGFALIELLVVIVIIAVLAALLFPVYGKVRRNAIEGRTISNLRQIGAAINAYATEHDDFLPGPLTVEQYPVFGSDSKKDKGSLTKLLAPYLSLSKNEKAPGKRHGEFDIFECPGATWPNSEEVPGYIMNMVIVDDYKQPAWGELAGDIPPLKRVTLTAWRDTLTNGNVMLARQWAMRHTDQEDCENFRLRGDWVKTLPKTPVFEDHYVALFFDWHVERFVPPTPLHTYSR
jgi:prepilin-type N-terminal cleavage/methylation domain-containing protein